MHSKLLDKRSGITMPFFIVFCGSFFCFVVRVLWFVVSGSWFLVRGFWFVFCVSFFVVRILWFIFCGSCFVFCGVCKGRF